MFDYLIIGKGLFGAAAARHLSQQRASVAIIGPDEPPNWAKHSGVFSSHYDQGRIATYNGPDEVWTQLDRASIDRYQTVEAASGIPFYQPTGLVTISPPAAAYNYPYHVAASANVRQYTNDTLPLPLQVPPGFNIFWEGAPTGYINPRAMIAAQLRVAQQQQTAVISQTVTHLYPHPNHITIQTDAGASYQTQKVLLATGAFANCFGLLPRPLALRNKTEATILAEVTPDTAARLAQMPPVNYKLNAASLSDIYLLPPIQYPNGRFYLKLGGNTPADHLLPTLDALRRWFQSSSHPYQETMQTALLTLMPDLNIISWTFKPCVVSYTPHTKPFIDALDQRIFIATGGNGGSAHPADAIGQLAADLMQNGRFSRPLPRSLFQLEYADDWSKWLTKPVDSASQQLYTR